jgi:hypothetical protein
MCGYDLRGLRETRCPECGLRFDPDAPPPPRVPWLVRRQIGWPRAYWRTAWLVVLRPDQLAEQAWRAAQYHADDAAVFRRTTALLAAASVALMVASSVSLSFPNHGQAIRETGLAFFRVLLPAIAFFWVLTIPVPLEAPTSVARQLSLQIEPLRPLCCAGLGLTPLVAVPFAMTTLLQRLTQRNFEDARIILFTIGLVAVLGAWGRGAMMYLIHGGRVGWNLLTLAAHAVLWAIGAFAAAVIVAALTTPIFRLFEY